MISNVGGGGQKKYKITSKKAPIVTLHDEYYAGEYVGIAMSQKVVYDFYQLVTESGKKFTLLSNTQSDVEYPSGSGKTTFIMPAENVSITY